MKNLPKLFPHFMIYLKSSPNGAEFKEAYLRTSRDYKLFLECLDRDMWGWDYPEYMQWYLNQDKLKSRTLTREEWHKARTHYRAYQRELYIDQQLSHGRNI